MHRRHGAKTEGKKGKGKSTLCSIATPTPFQETPFLLSLGSQNFKETRTPPSCFLPVTLHSYSLLANPLSTVPGTPFAPGTSLPCVVLPRANS